MSSIVLPTLFPNDCPLVPELKSVLASDANLKWWGQADTAYVAQSAGAVSQWNSIKSSAVSYVQATAANQAVLAAQSQIGGYDAAVFDGVNDRYTPSVAPVDLAGSFSLVALFGLASDAIGGGVSRAVWHAWTASNQQTGIYVTNTGSLFAYGSGSSHQLSSLVPTSSPQLVIVSMTGSTLRAALNGGGVLAKTATGSAPTTALVIGALNTSSYFKGWISDLMAWDTDLLAPGNEAKLAQVYDYFTGTYGLTFG